jgi:hypothetical protein
MVQMTPEKWLDYGGVVHPPDQSAVRRAILSKEVESGGQGTEYHYNASK